MESPVIKRSIAIDGHRTSVTLEDDFWIALKEIASARHLKLTQLVSSIDSTRDHANLSSAIRLFVLDHYIAMVGALATSQSGHAETHPLMQERA